MSSVDERSSWRSGLSREGAFAILGASAGAPGVFLRGGRDGAMGGVGPGLQAGRRVSEPFPAIAEASATGETADLFADIRATVGVRVVNLVWRHLATLDGALPWAWTAVKPLYLKGIADQAVVHFRESMIVPKLGSLAGPEPISVDAVLASYDHSNTVNL